MILFLFIIFIILWITIVCVIINIIRNSISNNLDIINYTYKPNIEVGDKVKLTNIKNTESPSILNKSFEVTKIVNNIVFLKSNDNMMITRNINDIKKVYNFIN